MSRIPYEETELKTCRLVDCKPGQKVRIERVDAGRGAILNLMNMGLSKGQEVTLVRKSPLHGPVLVHSEDAEVAIGHGLAGKIRVQRI